MPREATQGWPAEPASPSAGRVDALLGVALGLAAVTLLIALGAAAVMIRDPDRRSRSRLGTWAFRTGARAGGPLLLAGLLAGVLVFLSGLAGYVDLSAPPRDSLEIRVTGQKWKWLFTYPNGVTDDVLHVPLDTPVRLSITSSDVIHSLSLPALRIKAEAVPGRTTQLWFRPTRPGKTPLLCAEYCGASHHAMRSQLVVHGPGGFEKWLDAREQEPAERVPAELGRLVAERQGCIMCHTTWGRPSVGPTLQGLYGSRRRLADGSEVTADEEYLKESVLAPEAKIVEGHASSMPSYRGRLSQQELTGLVEYLKSLK